MLSRVVALILYAGLINGCSGSRSYVSDYEKNLYITTRTEASGFLASVDAAVDIYSVNSDCARQYQGTVDLRKTSVAVGLLPNTLSYLSFTFASSAFLANSHGTMSYDTVLVPRDGYDYDVSVSYIDKIYNVTIRERNSSSGESRELMTNLLVICGNSD
jgi:hypothetical protein